jgi:thiol-disulfide isomerase/thioredoxin
VLLGLAAGFAAWGVRSDASGEPTPPAAAKLTPVTAPVVGGLAPELRASSIDGDELRLSEMRGRVVLLNFWATWCEPCRVEMPLLEARYESRGLLVVGVNFDETEAEVRAYRDALGLTFPILLDPGGEVQVLYRVRGYPTTFLIDEVGVIQFVHVGSMDGETLDGYLQGMGLN